MAYIGAAVTKESDIKRITFATSTTGSGPFAIGWAPDSEASLRVTINGVVQHGSDITISGSNLTIAETLVSGDELEVVGIVSVGSAMVPQDGSVTTAKIARAGTAGQVLTSAGTGADVVWGVGNAGVKMVSKTSAFVMTAADFDDCGCLIINNDTSGGAYAVTMPAKADWAGKIIICTHGTDTEIGGVHALTLVKHASDGGATSMTSRAAGNTHYQILSTGDNLTIMSILFTDPDED